MYFRTRLVVVLHCTFPPFEGRICYEPQLLAFAAHRGAANAGASKSNMGGGGGSPRAFSGSFFGDGFWPPLRLGLFKSFQMGVH